jgi:signal transduction histidine kinase/ABC-type amino acid transport substrate-binding protein/ActR/RegA family two-component response regulator
MEKMFRRIIPWMLCLVMGLIAVGAETVFADEEEPRTVKVGFFAFEGYHEIDEYGNKSGYGYDFLQLTQKYANLNYEYVGYDKSWSETQQMLLDGEIDLATSAHITPERLEVFDFSLPIGTNTININTREDETRFVSGDYSTYDGMTLGLIKDSTSNTKIEEFAKENGFEFKARYYDNTEDLKTALESCEVDAVATSSLREMVNEKGLSEFGTEYFYAIVRKGDTELLNEINYAIEQLNSCEGDWKNTLYYDNYMTDIYDELEFTEEEQRFIERYSTGGEKLVIATDNAWKPFSWKTEDGYTGILPDYIDACMEMCGINYEFYGGDDEIYDASVLEAGKADLYICYTFDGENADESGLIVSSSIIQSGAAYLQRRDSNGIKSVAISATTPYINTRFEVEESVKITEYPDTESAKQAVLDGKADAAFLYSYDAEYTVNQDKTGKLVFSLVPDSSIDIRAAISADADHTLMSILMKCMNYMSGVETTAIVSDYVSFSATELSWWDYLLMHPAVIIVACVVVLIIIFVITVILLRNKTERKHRKTLEGKVEEITELNDQLTEKQNALEEVSAEQEAQLEEISALNEELEERQAQLEEAYEQAESANKAKTTFLFNMSHDIRTPMNAIIGFTDLLEKHQEQPQKRADYLKKIQDSSTVLLSIINNVLEMARIEKGMLVSDETAWSAEQFNDTLYSVFQDMMKEKGIEFTRLIEVEHEYVFCDPIKLREVFLNILSNAYKYTERGGRVNMHLSEVKSDRDGYAMYKTVISDTGMGMSEDFLPHIFEEFSRENNTTDNKIEGTGLGMPIVKRLVEFMDGKIEVQSEKGKGSKFTVYIPHRIAGRKDLVEHHNVKLDPEQFRGRRILLAEDNDLNAEIATEILKEAGFEVERAEDGQVCVDMVKNADVGHFDIILMDIQMPHMNGYEATKIIRTTLEAGRNDIPIIAMTANAFEEDKRQAIKCGMNGHLGKPVNVRELMKELSRILK